MYIYSKSIGMVFIYLNPGYPVRRGGVVVVDGGWRGVGKGIFLYQSTVLASFRGVKLYFSIVLHTVLVVIHSQNSNLICTICHPSVTQILKIIQQNGDG